MKKLLLVALFALASCSTEKQEEPQNNNCYEIISRGIDNRGNYIIIKVSDFQYKRYQVGNYLDWIERNELCEPITLNEQSI